MFKTLPDITVSFNNNGNVLLTFSPSEATWEFPKNNRLKLYNQLHAIINQQNESYYKEYEDFDEAVRNYQIIDVKQEISTNIFKIITDWVGKEELIIK